MCVCAYPMYAVHIKTHITTFSLKIKHARSGAHIITCEVLLVVVVVVPPPGEFRDAVVESDTVCARLRSPSRPPKRARRNRFRSATFARRRKSTHTLCPATVMWEGGFGWLVAQPSATRFTHYEHTRTHTQKIHVHKYRTYRTMASDWLMNLYRMRNSKGVAACIGA